MLAALLLSSSLAAASSCTLDSCVVRSAWCCALGGSGGLPVAALDMDTERTRSACRCRITSTPDVGGPEADVRVGRAADGEPDGSFRVASPPGGAPTGGTKGAEQD